VLEIHRWGSGIMSKRPKRRVIPFLNRAFRSVNVIENASGYDDDENHLDDGSAEEVVDDLQVYVGHLP
jgi:hypothetical protein